MYKRLSERLLDVFLKKLDVSEQRILYLKQTDFDDKHRMTRIPTAWNCSS